MAENGDTIGGSDWPDAGIPDDQMPDHPDEQPPPGGAPDNLGWADAPVVADRVKSGSYGVEEFQGGEFVGAVFKTSPNLTGANVEMSNDAWEGFPGVVFGRGNTSLEYPAALAAYGDDGRGFENGAIVLHGGRVLGGAESRIGATPTVTNAYTRSPDGATWSLVETKPSNSILQHQGPAVRSTTVVDDDAAAIYAVDAARNGSIVRADHVQATYGRLTPAGMKAVPFEPSLVAPTAPTGWSTQFLTGGIVVRESLAGKHCRVRVRFTRTGAALSLTNSFTTIAAGWIPASLRTSLEDHVDARIVATGDTMGVVRAQYGTGDIAVRAGVASLSVPTNAFFIVTLEWFVPTA